MKKNLYDQLKNHPRFPKCLDLEDSYRDEKEYSNIIRKHDQFISFLKSVELSERLIKESCVQHFSDSILTSWSAETLSEYIYQQDLIRDIK